YTPSAVISFTLLPGVRFFYPRLPIARHVLSVFFFYCAVCRRDLHSFPTRRSSDLFGGRDVGEGRLAALRPPFILAGDVAGAGGRSEEHTSELQSRENLVCRLLLEKKKRPSALLRRARQSQQRTVGDYAVLRALLLI